MKIRLRALGECVIEVGEHRITPENDVMFGLLLYLVCNAGRPVPRQRLVELFWPDATETNARHCLRQMCYRIRRLGLLMSGDGYAINLEGDVDADRLIEEVNDAEVAQLALTQGQPFVLPFAGDNYSGSFASWVEDLRGRLNGELRALLIDRMSKARASGSYRQLETLALACAALDPLNEEAALSRAEALAVRGSKLEAVRVLDQYVADLGEAPESLRIQPAILKRRIAERSDTGAGHPAIPLVGREREMAQLVSSIVGSKHAVRTSTLLVGEAGSGKSRLLSELAQIARLRGFAIVEARCKRNDSTRPLGLIGSMIPTLLAQPGALGASPASLATIRAFASAHRHGLSASHAQPTGIEERLRRALTDLVDAINAERRLLLLIDDVEEIDPHSAAVLDYATAHSSVRRIAARRYHPSVPRALSPEDAGVTSLTIAISALSAEESETLVKLAAAALSAAAKINSAEISSRAGGNPQFLLELTKAAVSGQSALPDSLRDLVEQRLSLLSPLAVRLLQAIAVLGRNATIANVLSLLEIEAHAAIDALAELERSDLVVIENAVLRCRYALTADVALTALPPASAKLLHHRAASTLARSAGPSPDPSLAWDYAAHLELSGSAESLKAAALNRAEYAMLLGLMSEAADVLVAALRKVRDPGDEFSLLGKLAVVARLKGDWRLVFTTTTRQRQLAQVLTPTREELELSEDSWLHAHWYLYYDLRTQVDAAHRLATKQSASPIHRVRVALRALIAADNYCARTTAMEIARSAESLLGDSSIHPLLAVRFHLLLAYCRGEWEEVLRLSDEHIKLVQDDPTTDELARALNWRGMVLANALRSEEGLVLLGEAFRIAERRGHGWVAASAAREACNAHCDLDNPAVAREWLGRAFVLYGPNCDAMDRAGLLLLDARLALAAGDLTSARGKLAEARGLCATSNSLPLRPAIQLAAFTVECELADSRPDLAAAIGELRSLLTEAGDALGNDRARQVLSRALRIEESIARL